MTPQHHVPEDALCEYTAGAASEPAALAIGCHIALCAACGALLLGYYGVLAGCLYGAFSPHGVAAEAG